MPETKQISATIDIEIANDVATLATKEDRSFSQMVEILLREVLTTRTLLSGKKKKDRIQ